jgi:hypothetical protein
MLGGYVFSRKRERQIREIVAGMQPSMPPAGPIIMDDPERDATVISFPALEAEYAKRAAEAVDTMPGPWTKNAAGELIG